MISTSWASSLLNVQDCLGDDQWAFMPTYIMSPNQCVSGHYHVSYWCWSFHKHKFLILDTTTEVLFNQSGSSKVIELMNTSIVPIHRYYNHIDVSNKTIHYDLVVNDIKVQIRLINHQRITWRCGNATSYCEFLWNWNGNIRINVSSISPCRLSGWLVRVTKKLPDSTSANQSLHRILF